MSFDHFVESLDNVPPELERNFTLMTKLDKNTETIMVKINNCIVEYKKTRDIEERENIRKESDELFEKLNSLADDKIELALQTYDLIDKNIKRLINLGTCRDPNVPNSNNNVTIGFDMPLDPNEPRYCICNGVSHGEMVACDNKECQIEWFHYACVGLRSAPKGKWYCGQCFNVGSVRKPSKARSRRHHRSY